MANVARILCPDIMSPMNADHEKELERIAEQTARCIDLDRAKVIAGVLIGDLRRAYQMGQAAERKISAL